MTYLKKINQVDDVLIIHNKEVDHQVLSRLLKSNGFPVTVSSKPISSHELENYGAVAHIGYSRDKLGDRLEERISKIKYEEWVLITGHDEHDLHCAVELTVHASSQLKSFIRMLWSKYSVP